MLIKKDLEHLAELARIDLKAGEEKKLTKDLSNILDYFKELQELNTDGVEPMTGGTDLKNALREDQLSQKSEVKSQKSIEAFPDEENGYLKVPPVF
ncbi:MAG: Asp-tRNA(Asn)/Glu-tRNA(Gln) amidotransferase subunit GatC, partial [Patescibacteria group bacterium]